MPDKTDNAADYAQGPAHRRKVLIHTVLQLVALTVIFWTVNYLSCRHYNRLDLTKNQRFTLSTTTTNFLNSLASDVKIIVAFLPDSQVYHDVTGLVDEYKSHGKKRVKVERVEIAHNPSRAAELKAKYGISLSRSSVIVIHGEKRIRVIPEEAMVRRSGGLVSQFNGEIALTAALISLVENRPRQVYLLDGYQRQEFQESVLAELRTLGGRQNTQVDLLSLTESSVPDDADAIFIAAPQVDPSEAEMNALQAYWQRGRGALFVSLDPDASTPRLNAFIRRHGVDPRDDRLIFASRVPGQPLQKIYSVPVMFAEGSPITQETSGLVMTLEGRSQSLALYPDVDFVREENIHLTPLLVADSRFWGETEYRGEDVRRDQKADHHAPLYLGAMVERGAVDDPELRIETQRMVVVSNPSVLMGGAERQKLQSDFVMSSLNWLLDRIELIGVTPKEPARYVVRMTPSQDRLLGSLVLWVFPGLVAGFGVFIWMLRRS